MESRAAKQKVSKIDGQLCKAVSYVKNGQLFARH